ncbi:MAG: DsrE family protein [Nitrospirae bacterium]|nr:DsrE family protein [Nitrospirota bacterium]
MEKKKLGVLLSTPPSHPNVTTTARLCEEAFQSGVDVYLYLIDEGVLSLRDHRLFGLSASGVKFFVCAYSCRRHGLSTESVGRDVTLCGLVVLSNIINGCDRFVAFN